MHKMFCFHCRIRPGEEEKLDGPGSQTGIITTSRSSTPATLASGKRSVLSTPKNHLSPIIEDALPEENIKGTNILLDIFF